MAEALTQAVSDRICQHMNEDHAEAITLYAKAFGGAVDTVAAEMVKIDSQGMDLLIQRNGMTEPLRIEFDHALQDAEDAHHTLIEMVKQARMQAPG